MKCKECGGHLPFGSFGYVKCEFCNVPNYVPIPGEKPIEALFEGLDIETYYKDPKISGLLKDVKEDFAFLFTGHWLQGVAEYRYE